MTDDELLLSTLEPSWLVPPLPRHLNADEPFGGLDAVVGDFWQFALGDLRMNTARGWLAEFLVARAVGATEQRVEWDSFDVKSPDGVRIEVKSGAYLQAWKQRRLSSITFGGLASRKLDDQNRYSESPVYGADVYVFAVQTATEHAVFDPLNTDQWDLGLAPGWLTLIGE